MENLLLEPWPERRDAITTAIADAADRITAVRVVIQRERKLSLASKMAEIAANTKSLNEKTSNALDSIIEKQAKAASKVNEAESKHHAYYDAIISGADESIAVIDRLSNGPLSEGGGV